MGRRTRRVQHTNWEFIKRYTAKKENYYCWVGAISVKKKAGEHKSSLQMIKQQQRNIIMWFWCRLQNHSTAGARWNVLLQRADKLDAYSNSTCMKCMRGKQENNSSHKRCSSQRFLTDHRSPFPSNIIFQNTPVQAYMSDCKYNK